jgi:hypothetical protein
MKHDFRQEPTGEPAERFCSWLEQETIDSLRRSYGDGEATKSAIFLFVNRAYEAHMPEEQIGQLFAKSIVRAGFREEDEEPAFAWLEHFGQIAAGVHGDGIRHEQG